MSNSTNLSSSTVLRICPSNNATIAAVGAHGGRGGQPPTEISRFDVLRYERISPVEISLKTTEGATLSIRFYREEFVDSFVSALQSGPPREIQKDKTDPMGLVLAPTASQSVRSNARVIDIDPNTNPLVRTYYTRGNHRLLTHRIAVAHITAWGEPGAEDRPHLDEDRDLHLAVLLDAGVVVLITFHSAADRSLFEEELDQKTSAL